MFWLLGNEQVNLDIKNPLEQMKLLLSISFNVHCIISFNCVLKSLLHHQQVPVSSYIIKHSLKLKGSDAETVCSGELLPT